MIETIGYCQWCGRLDHHLIDELCAGCLNKVNTRDTEANSTPLGVEAADLSAIQGYQPVLKTREAQ